MNLFYVKCPALINIYLNGFCNNNEKLSRVNDTIDIYDEVEVMVSRKSMESKIYLDNALLIGNNVIMDAINNFYDYTKLPHNGISVNVKKNIPVQINFNCLDSVAAGVILALNMHYHTGLFQSQLYEIAKNTSPLVLQYMYGGYHKVDVNDKIVYHKKESIHDTYLIALGNKKDDWGEDINFNDLGSNVPYNNHFYNYLEQMAPSELLDLKNRLLALKADKVTINGTNNSVVAYFSNHHDRFSAREELKKQKVKSLVVNSCEGIKIRRKCI